MRLANTTFDFVINLHENTVASIVCENPSVFQELIVNLRNLFYEEKSCWILSEKNGERIKTNKMDVIYSPFCFEINTTKFLNKVHKDLVDIINNELFEQQQNISKEFLELIDLASNKLSYCIEIQPECNVKDILKAYSVVLEEGYGSLLEKLVTYIKLSASIHQSKCLFLIDIKRYLTKKEVIDLYQEAFYQKLYLILIESKYEEKLENENVVIIDKQKCVIRL